MTTDNIIIQKLKKIEIKIKEYKYVLRNTNDNYKVRTSI